MTATKYLCGVAMLASAAFSANVEEAMVPSAQHALAGTTATTPAEEEAAGRELWGAPAWGGHYYRPPRPYYGKGGKSGGYGYRPGGKGGKSSGYDNDDGWWSGWGGRPSKGGKSGSYGGKGGKGGKSGNYSGGGGWSWGGGWPGWGPPPPRPCYCPRGKSGKTKGGKRKGRGLEAESPEGGDAEGRQLWGSPWYGPPNYGCHCYGKSLLHDKPLAFPVRLGSRTLPSSMFLPRRFTLLHCDSFFHRRIRLGQTTGLGPVVARLGQTTGLGRPLGVLRRLVPA